MLRLYWLGNLLPYREIQCELQRMFDPQIRLLADEPGPAPQQSVRAGVTEGGIGAYSGPLRFFNTRQRGHLAGKPTAPFANVGSQVLGGKLASRDLALY